MFLLRFKYNFLDSNIRLLFMMFHNIFLLINLNISAKLFTFNHFKKCTKILSLVTRRFSRPTTFYLLGGFRWTVWFFLLPSLNSLWRKMQSKCQLYYAGQSCIISLVQIHGFSVIEYKSIEFLQYSFECYFIY